MALDVHRHPEERPKAASRRMIGPARAVALRGSPGSRPGERLRVTGLSHWLMHGRRGDERHAFLIVLKVGIAAVRAEAGACECVEHLGFGVVGEAELAAQR